MTKTQSRILYTPKSEGFFVVPGVVDRGETGTYRVFENMTSSMTQDQLSELYETKNQKGNPHPVDSVLHFAIPLAAYNLKNESPNEAEKLRQFLRQGFRQFPNTLTRAIYNPSGKDKIVHNHGTSDEYSSDAEIVGPDGLIAKIPDKKILESLLGTDDIDKINEVSNWINGTNSYLWRLNSKPKNKEERVIGFCVGGDGFGLDCGRSPIVGYPAFRVLRIE